MYTNYKELDNKIVAIDEDNNISLFDKESDIEEILGLENKLEVLNIKSDSLEYALNNLENDFKHYKTPKQELVKFINGLNAILFTILILTLLTHNAFTLSSLIFLGAAETVMILATKSISDMGKKDFSLKRRELKEQIEENYKEISDYQKKLSDKKIKKNTYETKPVKDINALLRLRNTYGTTYKLDNDKRKSYNRI